MSLSDELVLCTIASDNETTNSEISAKLVVKAPPKAVGKNPRTEKRQRRRVRELQRLDQLLDALLLPSTPVVVASSSLFDRLCCVELPLAGTGVPNESRLSWSAMPPSCDPCRVSCHASARMAAGQPRGERKREQVSAFAWLLETILLPYADDLSRERPTTIETGCTNGQRVTIVDAGCSTGSLLLPLAFAFPDTHFVGVDLKAGSLRRLCERADAAGPTVRARVTTWQGRIEEYDGACDAVIALHACGGASDAALSLAARKCCPFAVSPCCVGKLSFGTNGSQPRYASQVGDREPQNELH